MKYVISFGVLLFGLVPAVAQNNPTAVTKPQKTTQAPAASGNDPRWAPGWVVDVLPRPLKDQKPEVVGRFIAKPEGFTFGDFRKTVPLPGWVSFRAHGTFDAKHIDPKIQRYAFTLIVVSASAAPGINYTTHCHESMSVDGIDIIPAENTKRSWSGYGKFETSVSAGVNLDQQSHEIEFTLSCDYGFSNEPNADRFFHEYPILKDIFDKTRVEFKVLTPDDLAPRAPAVSELVHPVKAPRR